jgi:hypothetical protein
VISFFVFEIVVEKHTQLLLIEIYLVAEIDELLLLKEKSLTESLIGA